LHQPVVAVTVSQKFEVLNVFRHTFWVAAVLVLVVTAAFGTQQWFTRQPVVLRGEPSASSTSVGYLTQDSEVTLLEDRGEWQKIRSGNQEGYLRKASLTTTVPVKPILMKPSENGVTIYKNPATNAPIVRSLYVWDEINVLSFTGEWAVIESAKGNGFVRRDKLIPLDALTQARPLPSVPGIQPPAETSLKRSPRDTKPGLNRPSPWLSVLTAVLQRGAQQLAQSRTTQNQSQYELMLFGGANHTTYLGCLNCSEFASDSILNELGKGNPFGQTIFNHFSEYGSRFSTHSACNPFATDPPVIVDSNGKYFGRFTLNSLHPQLGIGASWTQLVAAICE
jgi:hypothetical protein